MVTTANLAQIAALLGEPARAAMMQALMDGRALTATELAGVAGIAPQTASGHLAQLTQAGLLALERQGRHRYHRLASARVAQLLESLMLVAAQTRTAPRRVASGPKDAGLREARQCYDHIAGRLGVAIADALARQGLVEIGDEVAHVTARGTVFLAQHGIGLAPAGSARIACRPCLDWSERRPHLAGQLGAALCQHCLRQGWLRKGATRALEITPPGDAAFRALFGFERISGGARGREPAEGPAR